MSDKRITKEQADALYDDMQRALAGMLTRSVKQAKGNEGIKGATIPGNSKENSKRLVGDVVYDRGAGKTRGVNNQSIPEASTVGTPSMRAKDDSKIRASNSSKLQSVRVALNSRGGQGLALLLLAVLGCAKISLSAIEASGIGRIEQAQAVVANRAPFAGQGSAGREQWSKEEVKILKGLDARRVELEERSVLLDKREGEFSQKERALAVRLNELKELTERLKLERDKGEKQRSGQLDQLANVYGSMNPPEAAHLLEQLDIHVSMALIERMPEKRMAQILALMNSERALELTNLLSSRGSKH
jgi:flagellar motility protein MotE (MotC chaperone)